MDFNIISILYLIIRLSPLLVVSHFTLGSILNHDSKGVIYLAGLALTCLIAYFTGQIMKPTISTDTRDIVCHSIGLENIPNVSLSQVILMFTYSYLMFIIYKIDTVSYADDNLPTIILFPILIVANAIWVITSGCAEISTIIISAAIGAAGGFGWFMFIKNTGYHDLALFNGISNKAVCRKPSKTRFRCTKGKK
jgi:hypothetical protein